MAHKRSGGLWALLGTAVLALVGGAALVLWALSGYGPLLLLALLQLPAAGILALLLLSEGRVRPAPEAQPLPTGLRRWLCLAGRFVCRLGRALGNLWHKVHTVTVVLGALSLLLVTHWLGWPAVLSQSPTQGLQWLWAVVLAVLFVASLVAEIWLQHCRRSESCSPRWQALLQNIIQLLLVGRIGQLLCALSLVLTLTGLYDAQLILRIVLAALMSYTTVMLLLSLAIRAVRRELFTRPVLSLSPRGVDGQGLLTYLEENTGITMRSLWSIRLIRRLLPAAALFIVVLTWLTTGLVQVQSHQEGALYRLGRLQEETLKPGLHMTLPWPFDRVEVYDTTTVRKVTVGYEPNGATDNTWTDGHGMEEYRLLLGGGNEIVSINLTVEYVVEDLNAYLRASADVASLVEAASYEIVTARTISTDLDTLLSADRTVFSETFRQELVKRMDRYDCGVRIIGVVLESIHPPVEVADVFQQVISATIRAEQIVLEAERAAILSVTAAQKQAKADVSVASTSGYQDRAKAAGEVASFMASVGAYNSYPTAYTYYKYSTTAVDAYQKGVVIIVGEGVDAGSLVIGDLQRPVFEDPYFLEDEVEEEYYE